MPTALTLSGTHYSFDTTTKKFGSASIAFDGNQAYTDVTGGKVPATGDFGVSFWFKTSATGYRMWASQGGAFFIGHTSGRIYGNYGSGGNAQDFYGPAGSLFNDGAWHFLEIDIGASGLAVYVDGTLVASNSASDTAVGVSRTANPISLGGFSGASWNMLGNMDDFAVWSFARGGAVPSGALTGNENGLLNLYHFDGNGDDSVGTGAAVTIPATNAAIKFSPLNWYKGSQDVRTANVGAYFEVVVNGPCTFNFDVSNVAANAVKLAYRVDGGKWTDFVLGGNVLVDPAAASPGFAAPWHLVEFLYVSQSSQIDRWSATNGCAVILTSITSTSGSFAVKAPVKKPFSIGFFLDSLGEGYRSKNYTAANDIDKNDIRGSWAYRVALQLGCEFGIIAYAGQGWTYGAQGTGQGLKDSYPYVYATFARTWPADLRAIYAVEGTNQGTDTDSVTQAAMVTFINGVYAATTTPLTSIVLCRPLNGSQASLLQAAIPASGKGDRAFYQDTTGVYDATLGSDDTTLHPTAGNALGFIAPAMVERLKPYARQRQFTPQAIAA